MNNPKSKRPAGDTGMSRRGTAGSIKRIEDDLYYSSDNIKIRLTRIEEKLEHVATREDMDRFKIATHEDMGRLKMDMERQKSELIAHSNTQFRWTVGLFVSVAGVILTVLKLT